MSHVIFNTDALTVLKAMEDESVNCVVTSPPYWGLRDYKLEPLVWGGQEGCGHEWGETLRSSQRQRNGAEGGIHSARNADKLAENITLNPSQGCFCSLCGAWSGSLGLEPTPGLYAQHLVEIFREVRRVLREDGTLWLNLGDSYAAGGNGGHQKGEYFHGHTRREGDFVGQPKKAPPGLKSKDLVGTPWMTAFALRADGWWLRSDIIWHKPNPMPGSQQDRCTMAHEYVFMLAKSERYYFDTKAIAEPLATNPKENYPNRARITGRGTQGSARARGNDRDKSGGFPCNGARTKRDVWTIATVPFKGAHFATFPPKLVEPMILAGCPPGGIVLDPFVGTGTTLMVAERLGRDSIGIEPNATYCEMAEKRIASDR